MGRIKRHWLMGLAFQLILDALVCAGLLLVSFTQDASVGGILYDISMWVLIPLIGGVSAYLAVRFGLHYYLAWIAPPILQTLVQLCLTATLPASPGMPMVTLLVCALGAAAAQERNQREARGDVKSQK